MGRRTVNQKHRASEEERILGESNGNGYGSTQSIANNNQESRHSPISDQQNGPVSPETHANVFNRWTIWWANGLFRVGFNRQIQEDDLYQILDRRRAKVLGQLLADRWEMEKTRARAKNRTPSLLRALIMAFWTRYFPGYICLEIGDVCQIAAPWIFHSILVFVEQSQDAATTPPSAAQGFGLALAWFALSQVQNLVYQRWNMGSLKTGLYVRTALIDLVYQKATTLSARSHLLYPDGSIVNLMSTDISRVDSAANPFLIAICTPIYVAVVVCLLMNLMGPSALLGAAILMLSSPVQGWGMTTLGPVRKLASQMTDQRIRLSTEILQGIKVIKLFAWENSFLAKLAAIRSKELSHVRRILRNRGFIIATSSTLPILASALSLVLYSALGNELKPEIVFPALAYYGIMRVPMLIMPNCINMAVDAYVALGRIQEFLLAEDSEVKHEINSSLKEAIVMNHADFIWETLSSSNERAEISTGSESRPFLPCLQNIHLRIPRGSLVAVVGSVGSGKSSLLQAMVGNMTKSAGQVLQGTTISYASQTPWIQNASIRDNILFDTPFDEDRYWRVVRACCLDQDLKSFPSGDLTEIGERGVNLSGGQKARLSLARSVYFDAGMVIMDDPLSAVDAHVGARLWKECVLKELKAKTRVIATHQLHVLPSVDYIIFMKEGSIAEEGTYQELLAKGGTFSELMGQYGGVEESSRLSSGSATPVSSTDRDISKDIEFYSEAATETEQDEICNVDSTSAGKTETTTAGLKLVIEEEREIGAVGSQVYIQYFSMAGAGIWSAVLFCYILQQVCGILMNYWLSLWSDQSLPTTNNVNMLVYGGFGFAQCILFAIATQLLAEAIIRTTTAMHSAAFYHVLRAPLSFYDSTPIGRILNRFSKDVDVLDNVLWQMMNDILTTLLIVLGSVFVGITYFPYLIFAVFPMAGFYYGISVYYRSTSREVKRLDSTLRSKLYSYFSESLTGMGTIRAYDRVGLAVSTNRQRLDDSNRAYYLFQMGTRWIAFRVQVLGPLLILSAALYVVKERFVISAASAGLVLSYLARTSADMNFVVQMLASLENNMNAAERLVHYIKNLPQQSPTKSRPEFQPHQDWPSQGAIEFRDVTMRYRPELPPVLRGVSFNVQAGQKLGVVGRTGAGKSSLIQALFLLSELEQGHIILDGIDTQTLGAEDLRSKIGIIPQDPVLFQGSFRYNLDPLDRHTEQELWQVLETSDLKGYVQAQEGGLDAMISAQGENLSVGQRQLVCLSRALLAKSKIVVLDEATASVDMATDALIQRAIRVDFVSSTVITVAHRINTIIDYDKILVMQDGQVAEYASPQELLDNPDSAFSKLVDETGALNAAHLRSL
ncbi:hypothetical protein EMPS_08257 [Entomortierella parvispora]|uniref:Uncharacterized protein n=1 Tax=Entomortierella parvispora TaxID=205924 RepID=A0A9P3HFT5_9FUNG|nr:hypothetical protein EMPS_08257 [Entomortierella parvispora]